MDNRARTFSGKRQLDATTVVEVERDRLYAQIGTLPVQLDWLNTKTGHIG